MEKRQSWRKSAFTEEYIKLQPWTNIFISRRLSEQTGNVLWTKIYPYIQYNYPNIAWAQCFDTQGNLIVSGRGRLSGPYNDYKTVKYSPNGDLLWDRIYRGSGEDGSYAVTTDDSDNVYVTGWNGTTSTNILTIKYSPQGDTLWTSVFDAAGGDIGYDIVVDKYGYVYVGGVTHSSWYVTLKIDPTGKLVWSREQEGRGIPYFPIIKIDSSRNVYMAYTSFHPGPYSNYAVVKYDNDGNQKWIAEYYNGHFNFIYDMEVDKNANVYVTGKSDGGTGYSIATVKFIQYPTNIIQSTKVTDNYIISGNYPNPFNPETTIEFFTPVNGNVKIEIFDITGRIVDKISEEFYDKGEHKVTWNAGKRHSGIYFYRITSGNIKSKIHKMILIK